MRRFAVDELLQAARDRTGLSDFGPDDFLEGLEVLVRALNTEAGIREDRWEQVREQRLLRLLINRLWFEKDLKEHPEILDEELHAPIVIAGLVRTGSTKLHRILAATGGFQVLRFWNTNMFARVPDEPAGGRERRIRETRELEQWMYATSPSIHQGHPLYTDEAEEDQWLIEATFRHPLQFGLFESPSYGQWVMQTDLRPTFDYFLKQLKYLQWQSGERDKPWLLKTPNHFGSESFLTGIFDRKPSFLFTHRDPAKCIPSIVSTAQSMRMLYSDRDTSRSLGGGAINLYVQCTVDHMKWRDTRPGNPMLDLAFREISEHGIDTVRKVYDFLGMPFNAEAARGARQWEAANPKDKHGKSSYTSAALGTTDEAIRKSFAPYMERFSTYI